MSDLDIRFSLEPFERCREQMLAFRNQHRPQARDDQYIDWRYLARPCQIKPAVLWAHLANGEAVAAVSVIPHDFSVFGVEQAIGMLGDLSVAPSMQGQGLASRMLTYLKNHELWQGQVQKFFVLPNREASGALTRAGFQLATRVNREVMVLDARYRLRARLGNVVASVVAPFANALLRLNQRRFKTHCDTKRYQLVDVASFDERFDSLWQQLPKQELVLALRNRAYLQWRYKQHPLQTYQVLALQQRDQQKSLMAYLVFHQEQAWIAVDDFAAIHPLAAEALAGAFLNQIKRSKGAGDLQVRYNQDSLLAWPWRAYGLVARADQQQVMWMETVATSNRLALSDSKNWFVTPGDKDV